MWLTLGGDRIARMIHGDVGWAKQAVVSVGLRSRIGLQVENSL
jgi:hypothetical protein